MTRTLTGAPRLNWLRRARERGEGLVGGIGPHEGSRLIEVNLELGRDVGFDHIERLAGLTICAT